MPIDRLDFENLSENDLKELQTAQIPEGLRIDYKRELYGNSDADKREVLKDVSSFANSFGGHLIIGVEEKAGLPVAIPGVTNINPDDVILRLEQLTRDGIEPRIQGVRSQAIRLDTGAYCFVLRIPRSWYSPHRVSAQNSNRFWVRNSGGVHEASIEELRTLFTLGTTAFDRARQLRGDRLREIIAGRGPRPLQGDGRLILHIVPLAAVSSQWQVDLQAVLKNEHAFPPIGSLGMTPRFNFDGFINEQGGQLYSGYTQIFRNGVIEATMADIVREFEGRRVIPAIALERDVFKVLPGYFKGLSQIGVPPPLVVMLTLEGVNGAVYAVQKKQPIYVFSTEPIIERPTLFLPECVVNEYATELEYQRALKPAFDALWNAAGRASAGSFDSNGKWIGNLAG